MKKPKIKQEVLYMGHVRDVGFIPWVWSFSRRLALRSLCNEEKSKYIRREYGWRIVKVRISEVK